MAPLQLSDPLASAYRPLTYEEAVRACAHAGRLVERAKVRCAESQELRRTLRRRRTLWRQFRGHEVVTCCAFCNRARAPSGDWVAPTRVFRASLRNVPFSISHGACPDCLSEQLIARQSARKSDLTSA
jgi:hypothetical protein